MMDGSSRRLYMACIGCFGMIEITYPASANIEQKLGYICIRSTHPCITVCQTCVLSRDTTRRGMFEGDIDVKFFRDLPLSFDIILCNPIFEKLPESVKEGIIRHRASSDLGYIPNRYIRDAIDEQCKVTTLKIADGKLKTWDSAPLFLS